MTYNSNTKKRSKTDYIVVHCSATPEGKDFSAADIDRWHRQQGWACIGYHFVIKLDGSIEDGRDPDVIGAHVANWNDVSIGICLIGGVDANDRNKAKNTYTPAQLESLDTLLRLLKERYPNATIQGHRDFPNVKKACPCFDVKDWVKSQNI